MARFSRVLLCILAAPSLAARVNQELLDREHAMGLDNVEVEATLENFMKTGVWLTEACQDYPEASGFGLGDTVRIFRPNTREHNHVGLVGCQDPANPGKICLEDLKGCYELEEVRPVNTLVFTFQTLGGAAMQIFGAIKDDVTEAWQDLRMSMSSFASSVSNTITAKRAEIADKLNFCKPGEGEVSEKKFEKAVVQTKSRLAMLVDSSVERWGALKEGVKSMAETAMAKLVKIANQLSEQLSEFYDTHLKATVEALKRYLGGIIAAVTNVPDELNPLAGGKDAQVAAREVVQEPSGLSQAIEAFVEKVGELSAKLVEISKEAYEKVAAGLSALMSGAGRLIAVASAHFASAKATVQRLASDAVAKVQEWGKEAWNAMCNFDAKKTAQKAWASIQEGFDKAMYGVQRGYTYIKESVQETVLSLSTMAAAAAVTIKEKSVALWESDAVQGTLDRIREEIRVLAELIRESASLVAKFVGGFVKYFGRFIPQWVKDQFKDKATKAREMAKKIQEKIAELMGKLTDGETESVEVDAETVTVDA